MNVGRPNEEKCKYYDWCNKSTGRGGGTRAGIFIGSLNGGGEL